MLSDREQEFPVHVFTAERDRSNVSEMFGSISARIGIDDLLGRRTDGRPRSIHFVNDTAGQVLSRTECSSAASSPRNGYCSFNDHLGCVRTGAGREQRRTGLSHGLPRLTAANKNFVGGSIVY